MPSPPATSHATLPSDPSNAPNPSLIRRSSFEPLRLGALPPPVFSRGAPGQRSVPAVEYLKQEAAAQASAAVANSATTTPGVGLGNGAMSKEPWNLWNDASAPGAAASPAAAAVGTAGTKGGAVDSAGKSGSQDEELASALAASVVLDNSADKHSSVGGGSKRSSANPAAVQATWPEEFAANSSIPAQAFALDPTASPERTKSNASASDLSAGKSSLLPRNVSFSSLLDLPQQPLASQGSPTGGSPLKRTVSLNRAPTGSPTALMGSGLATGFDAAPSMPTLGGLNTGYTSPTALLRNQQPRTASNSPTQTRDYANAYANTPLRGLTGTGIPGPAAGYRGMDVNYINGESEMGSMGMRSRQPSAFSDISVTSMPFGPFYNGPQDSFNGIGNGSDMFGNRRDSGYGLSIYNSSPFVGYGGMGANDRQGRRGASWQYGSRNMPSYDNNASPYMPYGSGAFGDNSYMGMGASPSQNSSSSSLYRYPSNGSDGLMPNYGLGLVGPASPYMAMGGSMHGGGDQYYDRSRRYEEKSRPIRSPLLEEFRADKSRRWTVADMQGHIAEFMTDQIGSRYIQEFILEHPSPEDCDRIYEEIVPVILQLSTDVFANFCVQRLLEKASTTQVDNLALGLQGSILRLSLQTYGCRVIQKAIEVVSPEKQVMLIRELETSVQKCVRDQNANHVIQKIIQTCPADSLQSMVDAFVGHVYSFATHPYSCRVLQRILENCPERMTRPLLEELKSYAQNLMQDQYGNYVIQFCLERGAPQDKSDIIGVIFGQVLHLSKHKFASNVIEKCIMNANDLEIQTIANEVLAPRIDGSTGIQSMLRHEYANYPLQRLIKHTTGPLHLDIVEQVCQQLAFFKMTNPPFQAKHLVAVEKLLLDLSPQDFPSLMPRRFEDHYVPRR